MRQSRLTQLQQDLVSALRGEGEGFFLTGGAVLVGWVLGHRLTDDLDLFTVDDAAMALSDSLARRLAARVGAAVEPTQTSPDHRRYLFTRGEDATRVDFVRDRGPQLREKVVRDGIAMDSVEEIVANKLCTLVERSEIRDAVDLMFLERAGYRVEDYLVEAERKDAGATAATIAWLLSLLHVPEVPPAGVSRPELTGYLQDLEARLRRASLPGQ